MIALRYEYDVSFNLRGILTMNRTMTLGTSSASRPSKRRRLTLLCGMAAIGAATMALATVMTATQIGSSGNVAVSLDP